MFGRPSELDCALREHDTWWAPHRQTITSGSWHVISTELKTWKHEPTHARSHVDHLCFEHETIFGPRLMSPMWNTVPLSNPHIRLSPLLVSTVSRTVEITPMWLLCTQVPVSLLVHHLLTAFLPLSRMMTKLEIRTMVINQFFYRFQ